METLDWILLAHAVEREVLAGSKEGCVNYPPHFYPTPVSVNIEEVIRYLNVWLKLYFWLDAVTQR